jgi:ATP-dependent protease ClpP protease subunit
MQKNIDIKRELYAMASVSGKDAEITMYGQVVKSRPVDWWTGEEIKGDFIILDEFMADLEQLKDANRITIRMNSLGGDVYAALPIHNRLKELKAEKTVIVDGAAMSAASFIMCAADKVIVNEASLVMIHKAAAFLFDCYNADEMRELGGFLDTVDRALASAYVRKTGMDEDAVLQMMGDTTYMTGAEAVEKGFADELLDGEPVQIAAAADLRTLFVNGTAYRVPFPLTGLPENIAIENEEGGEKPMAETNTIIPDAAAGERKRIQDIDEVAHLFDAETVHNAKYGENPCTAQEMTYQAALKAKGQGQAFLSALNADAAAGGTSGVGASPPEDPNAAGEKEISSKEEAKTVVKGLLR